MKKLFLIATIATGLALTSCDSYLDINESPNSPTEDNMNANVMMPAAEVNLMATFGDFMRITGGYFAQYYTQTFGTSNYLDYSKFSMSATRSSGAYTQLTSRTLKSLDYVLRFSRDEQEWGTYLAATTLKAFTYQVLVDCYGEVPYTEAMQDLNNMSPKYDEGTDVYDAMIDSLDVALSRVVAANKVCTNLLFADQDATNWIRFANAVKLKMLMRESGVKDVQAKLDVLVAEGNFPTEDVEYKGIFKNESGQMSPFYAEEFSSAWGSTQQNVVANLAIIGTMQQSGYTDPRLPIFFKANGNKEFVGGLSGTNFSTTKSFKATYWCRPVASYDMPVSLISLSEIEFFLSEYYAKKGDAGNAAAHYAAAVEASFASAGVSGAAENIAKFPYDQNNYKQVIGIAKWVALAGVNTFESWCEIRRLNYPAFGNVKGSDMYDLKNDESFNPDLYVAGTLYTPIQVFGEIGDNKLLERWPYAESSAARNGNAPSFPGYTTPVFWGK
ncbi:MAG: SusD/RagB family nutrient-binding outer membrane lipoprotein [Prevotella sp.]|nr:SusD/RagB family nutrient-binding outer membrane lipoprotein [Prevotella sp.]